MLEALRKIVSDLHAELPRNNLVAWTAATSAGATRQSGPVVIKPSGMRFEELDAGNDGRGG